MASCIQIITLNVKNIVIIQPVKERQNIMLSSNRRLLYTEVNDNVILVESSINVIILAK
jgi:hypothetical protein